MAPRREGTGVKIREGKRHPGSNNKRHLGWKETYPAKE